MLHLSRKCFKRVNKVITASVLSNVTPRVQETFLSAEKVNASLITSLGQFFFHTKEDLVFFLFLNLTTIVDSYLTWWGIPHHIIGNSIKKVSAHFSTFFLFSQRKSLPPPWGYISSPPGFARLALSRYLCFWGWEKIGVMLRRAGTNVLNIFSTSRNEVDLFLRAHWKNQKWSHNASRNKISMTTDQFRKFCDVLDTADNDKRLITE